MILRAVHRSPGICLMAEENISARRPSDEEAVRPAIASNGVPSLQMRSVGTHSTLGKAMKENKKRTGVGKEHRVVERSEYTSLLTMWSRIRFPALPQFYMWIRYETWFPRLMRTIGSYLIEK